jgi:uncharacterized protein YndB with AHSA1/START domain
MKTTTTTDGRDLILTRHYEAPPAALYKAWVDPDTIKQWFAPRPWAITHAQLEVRAGGSSYMIMSGPNGEEMPLRGTFLEVEPDRKIVFTDAYSKAWEPSETPFMTCIITFEPEGTGTRYTARVRHFTVAAREEHEKMGFHQGWALCAEQLAELVEQKQ